MVTSIKQLLKLILKSATLKTDIYTLEVEVDYNNKIDPLKSSLEIEHIHYFNGFEKDDKLTNIILNKSIKIFLGFNSICRIFIFHAYFQDN